MQARLSIPSSVKAGSDPIELAPGVWWVGCHLDDDVFQCHAYLIEDGDQSVLFDPGSQLTWEHTLEKIEKITSFDNIRWFVIHHQDPDICGVLPEIDRRITRDDARFVTHWRGEALLKHYGPKTPFHRIEDGDWHLQTKSRKLEFVFTPYLHFPGAFTTFDTESGILFSSDLFGGFTEGDELIVQGPEDFEGAEMFHQHYMPSHDTLLHSMVRIEQLPLQAIAPQHGRIITGDNIWYYINRLKSLDCGLYLLAKTDSDVQRLQVLNDLLRDAVDSMVLEKDFRVIIGKILGKIREIVPACNAEILAAIGDARALHLSSEDRFHGRIVTAPSALKQLSGLPKERCSEQDFAKIAQADPISRPVGGDDLHLPLYSAAGGLIGLAIFHWQEDDHDWQEFDDIMRRVALPLSVACEREIMMRELEMERDLIYERSIRDPLTGLYTRRYLDDSAKRMVELHLRDPNAGFAMLIADIDFFKNVNDTHGHLAGDQVLASVGVLLQELSRQSDIAVRYGGEEFALFLPLTDLDSAMQAAERIRAAVESTPIDVDGTDLQITVSLGVATHFPEESIDDVFRRADAALYAAKEGGRNQVRAAD